MDILLLALIDELVDELRVGEQEGEADELKDGECERNRNSAFLFLVVEIVRLSFGSYFLCAC